MSKYWYTGTQIMGMLLYITNSYAFTRLRIRNSQYSLKPSLQYSRKCKWNNNLERIVLNKRIILKYETLLPIWYSFHSSVVNNICPLSRWAKFKNRSGSGFRKCKNNNISPRGWKQTMESNDQSNKKRLEVVDSAGSLDETCKTFVFHNEDHTLGNSLRYMIMKNPEVQFCGYSVPHPSESKINFRIQTHGELATDVLKKGLKDLNSVCEHVLATFQSSVQDFKRRDVEMADGWINLKWSSRYDQIMIYKFRRTAVYLYENVTFSLWFCYYLMYRFVSIVYFHVNKEKQTLQLKIE